MPRTGQRDGRAAAQTSACEIARPGVLSARGVRTMQLVDSSGQSLIGAAWSVSDPVVAGLETNGDEVMVRGLSPGQAVLTASWGPFMTVRAELTVMGGTACTR